MTFPTAGVGRLRYACRMSPSGRWMRALCVVGCLLFGVVGLRAQGDAASAHVFVAEGLGRGTVAVDGPWQFRTGDDLAWAAPGLDDSGWESVDVGRLVGRAGALGVCGAGVVSADN